MALWLVTCLVFVTGVAVLRNYFELVDNSGDSSAYMAVASAIRQWNFHGPIGRISHRKWSNAHLGKVSYRTENEQLAGPVRQQVI